jgi:hypothetical protein
MPDEGKGDDTDPNDRFLREHGDPSQHPCYEPAGVTEANNKGYEPPASFKITHDGKR